LRPKFFKALWILLGYSVIHTLSIHKKSRYRKNIPLLFSENETETVLNNQNFHEIGFVTWSLRKFCKIMEAL
jgi:hypothetical protein